MFKFNFPVKIALFYLSVGVLWILLSDKAILVLTDSASGEQITRIQNYKGVFFIVLTSFLLFLTSNYYYKKQQKIVRFSDQHSDRLNNMLESITDGFFAVDKDWTITHINNSCAKLFGTTSREILIGKKLWSLFPGYTNSRSYNEYNRAVNDQITVHFEDYLPPYQSWFEVTAYPFKNGLAVYFRDITQQKLTRRALMLEKSNLDALINNTNDLIWSIDKEFNLLSFNKSFFETMKFFVPEEEIGLGANVNFPNHKNKQIFQDWVDYYNRALAGERFSIEYQSETNDQIFYSETNFNPIYNEHQEIIGIGCFSRNISERKKNEEERVLLIQRLLNQNKDLEEFSFIASHNLRSPVASILGLIQIYDKEKPEDEYNKTVVENLEKTALKLDEIIVDLTQILDIRHRIDEAKEKIPLESVTETTKNMLASHIEKSAAVIHFDFKVPEIFVVKSYLNNILYNLISNAIKYRKDTIQPVIRISSEISDGWVLLKVEDNGIGLDLVKHGEKLFMPYKRFHDHVGGKGIGLYLVKSQVEALGGNIQVTSTVGEGTTFCIYLKNSR